MGPGAAQLRSVFPTFLKQAVCLTRESSGRDSAAENQGTLDTLGGKPGCREAGRREAWCCQVRVDKNSQSSGPTDEAQLNLVSCSERITEKETRKT